VVREHIAAAREYQRLSFNTQWNLLNEVETLKERVEALERKVEDLEMKEKADMTSQQHW
jgi:polyhydroxyalkanoate synthesis regulator phasin